MSKVYEIVTNQIINAIEKGTVPWASPYVAGVKHQNLITKIPYHGVNIMLLGLVAQANGYQYPLWLTYNQAKQKGWHVKKGAKTAMVTFFKMYQPKIKDIADDDIAEEEETTKSIPVLRYYNVFNIAELDECDEIVNKKATETCKVVAISDLEKEYKIFLHTYISKEKIEYIENEINGLVSAYNPVKDRIRMSNVKPENFLQVLSHEVIHSTGHPKRLNRFAIDKFAETEEYSAEELVAEIGSCMMMAQAGLQPNIENSASYCNGWAEFLRDKKKAIVSASAKAEKACDFVVKVAGIKKLKEAV
jgi:antirestriction protein ArdC